MQFLQYLNPFRKPSAQHMRNVLIEEADRLAIEHAQHAEKCVVDAKGHRELCDMYKARAKRLRAESNKGA